MNITKTLLATSKQVSKFVSNIDYPSNLFVYNVYSYAWKAWCSYIDKYFTSTKKTLICGINPGPHGMVQTGIPFGAVSQVQSYLGIKNGVVQPRVQHPKRPINGFKHHIEEKSGTRFWHAIAKVFPLAEHFFYNFAVLNFCPLAFLDQNGKNLTPDQLPTRAKHLLEQYCENHLLTYITLLKINTILCIGRYAEHVIKKMVNAHHYTNTIQLYYISHPSPLNPKHKEFENMLRPHLLQYQLIPEREL